jgi:hypothetical protein
MRPMILAAVTLAAAFAFGGAPAEARTVTSQVVRGRLLPPDDASRAHGKFKMLVQTRGEASREFLYADAWGLDTTRDDEGNLPSYRCWLVNADASVAADFGECYLTARGRAKVRFHTAREEFPEGVSSLVEFEGGVIEIRLDTTVVLAGDIPEFVGVTDDNGRGTHAAARAHGVKRLKATEAGGDAKGFVEALYANTPRGTFESLRVECLGIGSAGDAFTVVVIDDGGGETELGTMNSRTRFGVGVLALSTRRGDTIPGDGVLSFGGMRVEVRDADGVAWLEGRFPVLVRE